MRAQAQPDVGYHPVPGAKTMKHGVDGGCRGRALGQKQGREILMKMPVWTAIFCVATAASAQARREVVGVLPPEDPGYSIKFHDGGAAPNPATRWGYHDGWTDGRHDRNAGRVAVKASEKANYVQVPMHFSQEVGQRDAYIRQYRGAYGAGYERGSRQ